MSHADSRSRVPTPPPMPGEDPLIGKVLNGRFRILEPIGVGGMGKVYRAIQTGLERVVAVKVLSPNFPQARDPGFQQRFLREASMTSKLRHPNTVTVIDYGQSEEGIFYIAMEYLEGQTLDTVLHRVKQLDYVRALGIIGMVARSLREAHAHGIIHRDLKPANVMLIPDKDQDVVKVLDFGLVKSFVPDGQAPKSAEITQSGTFLGSPQYMAPEQARNQSDPRSDVYSLGVLLYQMLMGRPPFLSKDYLEVIFQHHKEPPPPFRQVRPDLGVPDPVEQLVMKCLAKDPNARFQSMDELIEGIRQAGLAAGGSGVFRAMGRATTTGQFNQPGFSGTSSQSGVGTQPISMFGVQVKDESDGIEINLEESPLKSKKVLAIGAVVLAALIGFGVVYGLGGSAEKAPTSAAAVGEVPQDEGAEAPAAQITQTGERGDKVKFRIGSMPQGAIVYVGGKRVGKTPTEIEVKADADGTATAEITFALEGYHTLTLVAGGSGTVVLTQPLQKRPERGPRSRVSSRSASSSPSPSQPEIATEQAPDIATVSPDVVPAVTSAASKPAEAKPAAATVIPFGEGMTRPVMLSGKEIEYTREARVAKVQGLMIVKCVIAVTGALENCRVLKSIPLMEQAVLDALKTRRYTPVSYQGKPVAVDYVFNLRLSLPK